MCRLLKVARAGFYAWLKRNPSARQSRQQKLLEKIKAKHLENRELYGSPRVHLSAATGEGIDDLWTAIRSTISNQHTDLSDDFVLTSARQNDAILKAIEALRCACEALDKKVPHEMVLLDLYRAVSALDELTGEIVTDDILDRIFSMFCIGK